jgi:hypothetical protein
MDSEKYRQYLRQFIGEAKANSDGTNRGISAYLQEMKVKKGFWVKDKVEQSRALADARVAFEEHRHWPLEIILSQLGISLTEPKQ